MLITNILVVQTTVKYPLLPAGGLSDTSIRTVYGSSATTGDRSEVNTVSLMPPPAIITPTLAMSRRQTIRFAADDVTPLLGRLVPTAGSIKCPIVPITASEIEFGRANSCTTVYKPSTNNLVPRSAITIAICDSLTGVQARAEDSRNWVNMPFYALIATRSSSHILVNGAAITRNKKSTLAEQPFGMIFNDDTIEVFETDDGTLKEHLRFRVRFYAGVAQEKRIQDFKVVFGFAAAKKMIDEDFAQRTRVTSRTAQAQKTSFDVLPPAATAPGRI